MERKNENIRYFSLLFIGQTISDLGTSMTGFATVIWAYSEKGQAMDSSLLAVCSILPYLIVSLWGGAAADQVNKKKIMLVCDLAAAAGSLVILVSCVFNVLQLWILCLVNAVSGFMNAFQKPASQVAVTLLINREDYARVSGIQSAVKGGMGIFKPVLAAALLSAGGLELVLIVDLATFFFAFITLLLFVKIPDQVKADEQTGFRAVWEGLKEGLRFIRKERAILVLLSMYSILELIGAISFDGMFYPLVLARTGNNEQAVGTISAFMAAGCLASSMMLSVMRPPKRKLWWMYFGSYLCLAGITCFGMGRNMPWWCAVVFLGCFGSPVYHTFQTVIIREKVDVSMQGRVFSVQGMMTEILTPAGYLFGAFLADYVFEPFMGKEGPLQNMLAVMVGRGKGAGMGLIFVLAGMLGIILLSVLRKNSMLRGLEE